jgi:hypothetical protein
MRAFSTETKAFKAGGDKVAALCLEGKANTGFRILKQGDQYVVLLVPDRMRNEKGQHYQDTPYYLD